MVFLEPDVAVGRFGRVADDWSVGGVGLVSKTTWKSWSRGLAAHGVISFAFSGQIPSQQGGVVTGGRIHRRIDGGDGLVAGGSFAGAAGRVGERDRCADLLHDHGQIVT